VRTIARDAWQNWLKLVEQLFAQGHSCEHILGDVFHPLTGSKRALPSTAVRWRAGFASRITGQRFGKETWGSMKGRGLELG
jgi:hypothetical protein